MSSDEWQWPTKSTDPGVNVVIVVFLCLTILVAAAFIIEAVIPLLILIAIIKGVQWYVTRPVSTAQLAAQTEQRAITANFPKPEDFMQSHFVRLIEGFGDTPPAYQVYLAMGHVSGMLYRAEDLSNPLPPVPPRNTIDDGRYRDHLLAQLRKSADAPKTLEALATTFGDIHMRFLDMLPPLAKTTRDIFMQTDEWQPFATFPLIDLLPRPGQLITPLVAPVFSEQARELALFTSVRDQLERNLYQASGLDGPAPANKIVMAEDHKGSPREVVTAYLQGTPFEALFWALIPFAFSDEQRFEHMHVIGGSGHGKTQLLQHLILNDLKRPSPPALIVIDSQGEMLRRIQRLALFAPGQPLADRLIIIDPEDVDHPPALNMFDTQAERHGAYSRSVKEQIEASTIEMFNYVFGALAAELTSRQNTTFAFVARLMLSIPGATIHTLRALFEDGAASIEASPFAEHIRQLDPTSQAYFENQFFTKTSTQTKQQIARRLYGVLQVPAFDRMFASRDNKLDMFEAMQSRAIVLINTSKAMLKSDASALFGRHMIARVIAAAFERIAVPRERRNPAFLIVDEAAEYFDDNLETLLSQARKFNVGVLFAHQHLDQLAPSLRASVAANTSIKLAGGISDKDARALASDMRTSADFIASMNKHAKATEFACYVRNQTVNSVRLNIPFGTLEGADTMTDAQHRHVLAANRHRYAISPDEPRPAATSPGTPRQDPTAEAEDDWRS